MVTTLTNLTQINPSATNRPPEGIEKIDRDSTPELSEIAAQYKQIQTDVDNANGGLNPLGLARDEVPFDIRPGGRLTPAKRTSNKSTTARSRRCSMRWLPSTTPAASASNCVSSMIRSMISPNHWPHSEIDYHNQLIEIFGYPYSDDIGPTGQLSAGL